MILLPVWRMGPRLRKVMLAIHLTTSVGWLGAVLAYLVLDISVSTTSDAQTARLGWQAMGMVVSGAIVPLAGLALITGLIQALGTPWGLIRYWWVVISLLLTVVAVIVLVSEAEGIVRIAALAADPNTPDDSFRTMRGTLFHSVGGLTVLGIVQVLNVLKPQGLTPYGWRYQLAERRRREDRASPSRREAT